MATEPETRLDASPGLLALARERMRTRHLARRTEQAYLQWLERYVAFHHGRHPRTLGAAQRDARYPREEAAGGAELGGGAAAAGAAAGHGTPGSSAQ